MNKGYDFNEFQILETLDTTHEGHTKIYVIKHHEKIMVCKSILKEFFKDAKSVEHINNQKQALLEFTKRKNLGVNQIIQTFQDQKNLYILLQIVQGLPLHKLLQMAGPFNQQFTRLIVSQVGLIMKDFHEAGYIYRDIKASNFMINVKGKVTMIDLGKAKHINKERTFTICGTTHSMPPQIYENKGYSYQFDYYSFGVLIYELLTGAAPFGYRDFSEQYLKEVKQGLNQSHLQKILCETTRDLITRLMQVPQKRLGKERGFEEILQHQYFNCPQFLDYKDILECQQEINKKDQKFEFYISQIEDFGLDLVKYEQITKDDPFYKFYN